MRLDQQPEVGLEKLKYKLARNAAIQLTHILLAAVPGTRLFQS